MGSEEWSDPAKMRETENGKEMNLGFSDSLPRLPDEFADSVFPENPRIAPERESPRELRAMKSRAHTLPHIR